MDAIALEVFKNALSGIAEEMNAVLVRTAFSPNIKERRDCSCALFDRDGQLIAQSESIPVHLGAMPFSVAEALRAFANDIQPGDVIVLNDPFMGGAHLPDITFVTPIFSQETLIGFAANRAHHADVGGMRPGSIAADATEIYQEGLRIPPVKLWRAGRLDRDLLALILSNTRTPREREADLRAQFAANERGRQRLLELPCTLSDFAELLDYSERRMRHELQKIPAGVYTAEDSLDDGSPIRVRVTVSNSDVLVDFTGTAPQIERPLNAVFAVTASAVYYTLRALTDPEIPPNAGCYRPIRIIAPEGTLVNARPPAPVVGGNLEVSQRIVDVLLKALAPALPERVPAASQGTMNSVSFGGIDPRTGEPFTFYETLAGGQGARPTQDGLHAIHSHMTNTLNTPIEVLETVYPLRVERYEIRVGSGGRGRYRGGDGLRRDIRALTRVTVSLLADRRRRRPYGLAGGEPGACGEDFIIRDGHEIPIAGQSTQTLEPGDILSVRTPGGGGYGPPIILP
ncbi:MAG: hydantoinase B/oxoprolinase family protein [Candidatus Bipolaricaulota bacterium]|nr:hydantoinase B/oxoprolinase family protein [Candidatus Bipolaricaulota bacterium]MCS7274409.1 hydantoinase B/oxoprolinase family protein [Candidatus Bipolaricaulota bacterium]MDW8110247.1 hydantoinase B/oxoprolinase family protein [Candidatus Bipolaricaulota bacterium]MDW8328853.1 hydantoinase B/oxoprolinase family protein [Candidatus Bipolaricaulota bacterium]